jgi:hypothetical protein
MRIPGVQISALIGGDADDTSVIARRNAGPYLVAI